MRGYHVPPEEFERIAQAALDSIPPPLRARMERDNLLITVQPGAPDDDDDVDERVLGYYEDQSESTFAPYSYPKRIVLLQSHIERWSRSHAELVAQVTDTVLHEVAHYFGMSHDDIQQTRLRH